MLTDVSVQSHKMFICKTFTDNIFYSFPQQYPLLQHIYPLVATKALIIYFMVMLSNFLESCCHPEVARQPAVTPRSYYM